MQRIYATVLLFIGLLPICAQDAALPNDIRQHNLTQFNSSLFNPSFSLDRNMPRSLSLWSRWQWQTIDTDPTSIFLNYSQMFTAESSGGLGFYQNNTGVFLNTGAVLNYAHRIPLGENAGLIFGANVFVFQQELADDRFTPDDQIDLIELSDENSFIAQFAPGLRINVNDFNMAMTIENALDYNFTDNEREAVERIFSASISNAFPVFLLDEVSYVRPMAYVRAIPNSDTQYGLTALFTNPKFWVQGGYNSFYGVSGGAGVTLKGKFSLGALVEFGIDDMVADEDPTFEVVASYFFGKQNFEPKEKKEKKTAEERMEEIAERRRLAEEERERLRLEEAARLAQARKDSIEQARALQLQAEREQARLDSIARVEREREVEVLPNERYEEVVTADGVAPGFYLIANVFGTKRYFENFMETLRKQGLEPKSFYRSVNKYNYVYLERYDSIDAARQARDSGFNGSYDGSMWIFRVRGQ
ncbi:PorP/SprF family type IX secretion system membrane protein [Flagellimonas sp. DF-77]|uniref:PorP/SprF family type IX secretion system membrane protein n=1 Tax=Flagellimonas algarum TaxID=3230298 RepID=UPI0033984357